MGFLVFIQWQCDFKSSNLENFILIFCRIKPECFFSCDTGIWDVYILSWLSPHGRKWLQMLWIAAVASKHVNSPTRFLEVIVTLLVDDGNSLPGKAEMACLYNVFDYCWWMLEENWTKIFTSFLHNLIIFLYTGSCVLSIKNFF